MARLTPPAAGRASPSYGRRLGAALYHARKRRVARIAATPTPTPVAIFSDDFSEDFQ